MLAATLKECDITDSSIPQEVKDFYDYVNKYFWPTNDDRFVLTVSECNDQYYALILKLDCMCVYIEDFGTIDIKDATVGVTFDDKTKKRISAVLSDIPRDEVIRRSVQLYYWMLDQIDALDTDYLDWEAGE